MRKDEAAFTIGDAGSHCCPCGLEQCAWCECRVGFRVMGLRVEGLGDDSLRACVGDLIFAFS